MHKFIFITNQYLPSPGATGVCVHAVASCLAEKGNDVHVVCYGEQKNEYLIIDKVKIHKVKTPFFLSHITNGSISKKLIKLCSLFAKLIYIRNYPLRSMGLTRRMLKTASDLLTDSSDATAIATYTPIEADLALLKLKERYPKLKTIFYSTDTLSNEKGNSGFLPQKRREEMGKKWEYKIFSEVDKILIMECHKPYYLGDIYLQFKTKMAFANFPLLREPGIATTKRQFPESGKRLFVFAGSLYKDLRNPCHICEFLLQMVNYVDFVAVFLGGGDCDDLMKTFEDKSEGVIRFMGMQSYEMALNYINDADVLLSIGNKESPMMPSKIYEYMATGKPILHYYSWDEDSCLQPLMKYGNSLLIKEGIDYDIEEVKGFLGNPKYLAFEKVKSDFITSTPQYTADIIMSI